MQTRAHAAHGAFISRRQTLELPNVFIRHAQALRGLGICGDLDVARAGGGGCMLRLNEILLQGGGGWGGAVAE